MHAAIQGRITSLSEKQLAEYVYLKSLVFLVTFIYISHHPLLFSTVPLLLHMYKKNLYDDSLSEVNKALTHK